jgi:hypothetical protein
MPTKMIAQIGQAFPELRCRKLCELIGTCVHFSGILPNSASSIPASNTANYPIRDRIKAFRNLL